MGSRYGMAMGKAIQYYKGNSLYLSNNNIGPQSAKVFIKNLRPQVELLDLNKNSIGDSSVRELITWFDNKLE